MSDDEDQYQEDLNDAVEAGGCTEIWETLSEKRNSDDQFDYPECDSE